MIKHCYRRESFSPVTMGDGVGLLLRGTLAANGSKCPV